jgi:hypothetical protein
VQLVFFPEITLPHSIGRGIGGQNSGQIWGPVSVIIDGKISAVTIAGLEERKVEYVLGGARALRRGRARNRAR